MGSRSTIKVILYSMGSRSTIKVILYSIGSRSTIKVILYSMGSRSVTQGYSPVVAIKFNVEKRTSGFQIVFETFIMVSKFNIFGHWSSLPSLCGVQIARWYISPLFAAYRSHICIYFSSLCGVQITHLYISPLFMAYRSHFNIFLLSLWRTDHTLVYRDTDGNLVAHDPETGDIETIVGNSTFVSWQTANRGNLVTLGPAYSAFGYHEHPSITTIFVSFRKEDFWLTSMFQRLGCNKYC